MPLKIKKNFLIKTFVLGLFFFGAIFYGHFSQAVHFRQILLSNNVPSLPDQAADQKETCTDGRCPGHCLCVLQDPDTEKIRNSILYQTKQDYLLWEVRYAGEIEENSTKEYAHLNVDIRNEDKNKKCQVYGKITYRGEPPTDINKSRLSYEASCVFVQENYCCCVVTTAGSETTNYSCAIKNAESYGESECKSANGVVKGMPADGSCKSLETVGEVTTNVDKTSLNISEQELLTKAKSLNPFGIGSAQDVVGRIINAMLAFVGTIAFVFYLWAGFLWMTAAGSSERIESAKKIMLWTTLGLVMMFASYILVKFLFTSVGSL